LLLGSRTMNLDCVAWESSESWSTFRDHKPAQAVG
jgi:hypothetical protein